MFTRSPLGDGERSTACAQRSPPWPCRHAPACPPGCPAAPQVEQLGDPRSPLNVGTSGLWQMMAFTTPGGRLMRELPRDAWQAVADLLATRERECEATGLKSG